MSRNLYGIIETSDLTMRSRIDLKKEIKSNKITDEITLLIRIDQKKEEEFKQSEEKLNDDNNISSTNPISNKSELKHKIEEGNYVPSTELYSYVISSNTSQRFKDRLKKEIRTTNDYQDIIQKVKKEENITKLISIVNKSDLSYSSKREIINQIRKEEITTKEPVKNRIKTFKEIIEKEREKDELKRKKIIEQKKIKKERENLIFKVNSSSLNYFSKNKLIEEIRYCKNPDSYILPLSSELKKEELYSYVDSLNIFAGWSEISRKSKTELKTQIYMGTLSTKEEIDDARNKLIREHELNKSKRKKHHKSYNRYNMNYNYEKPSGGWER